MIVQKSVKQTGGYKTSIGETLPPYLDCKDFTDTDSFSNQGRVLKITRKGTCRRL